MAEQNHRGGGNEGPNTMFARGIASLRDRRVRAVVHLLSGTSGTVVLSLLSITLAARALGPQEYGVLALILTLGQACERLLSFQSWQPLIRYGSTFEMESDSDDLRSLLKFGLMLDFAGSAAAWLVSSLLAIASHFVLAVPWSTVTVALIFMSALLFNLNGTAIYRVATDGKGLDKSELIVGELTRDMQLARGQERVFSIAVPSGARSISSAGGKCATSSSHRR